MGSSGKALVMLDCASVEESATVAVKVESIGVVDEDFLCVFLLVVRVSDAERLFETDEADALPDIADEEVMILEGSMELGRRVVSFWDVHGVLPIEFVVEIGVEVLQLPGHADE